MKSTYHKYIHVFVIWGKKKANQRFQESCEPASLPAPRGPWARLSPASPAAQEAKAAGTVLAAGGTEPGAPREGDPRACPAPASALPVARPGPGPGPHQPPVVRQDAHRHGPEVLQQILLLRRRQLGGQVPHQQRPPAPPRHAGVRRDSGVRRDGAQPRAACPQLLSARRRHGRAGPSSAGGTGGANRARARAGLPPQVSRDWRPRGGGGKRARTRERPLLAEPARGRPRCRSAHPLTL